MVRSKGGYCQTYISAKVKDLGLYVGGVLLHALALVSLGFHLPSSFLPLQEYCEDKYGEDCIVFRLEPHVSLIQHTVKEVS